MCEYVLLCCLNIHIFSYTINNCSLIIVWSNTSDYRSLDVYQFVFIDYFLWSRRQTKRSLWTSDPWSVPTKQTSLSLFGAYTLTNRNLYMNRSRQNTLTCCHLKTLSLLNLKWLNDKNSIYPSLLRHHYSVTFVSNFSIWTSAMCSYHYLHYIDAE